MSWHAQGTVLLKRFCKTECYTTYFGSYELNSQHLKKKEKSNQSD